MTRRWVARSLVLALGLLAALTVTATPSQAAWTPQVFVTLQVTSSYNGTTQMVGRAEGWVQLDDGGNAFRYSFTFCRQSSFSQPYMSVSVNVYTVGGTRYATPIANLYPSYVDYSSSQPCYGQTGTVANEHSYPNFFNVEFKLVGSSFDNNVYTERSRSALFSNPY